ncbi:MAG: erythromycin esterase family protein [Deltaproteobacteria bacterium]|nr:erythromycin esterase family protein [Deltaproteobacteria bacterium]
MMRGVMLLAMLASCNEPVRSGGGAARFPAVSEDHVLAAGETAHYSVAMNHDESCALVVTQQGVDVVVEAFAPDGTKLATVDSPNGREGDEPLEILARQNGTYRIDVRALDPTSTGRYRIAATARRDAAQTRAVLAERARARAEATRWLQARSGPFTLVDSTVEGIGLARFDALLERARVVGIGEATHGSHQFGDMRLALTMRAIEQHGVRVVGLEASASRMRLVDAWTRDGIGDLPTMIGKQWINRRAFTALATHVRAWNTAHPKDPVTIVGLDDQDHAPAREIVARAVQAFDADYAKRVADVLARIEKSDAQAMVFGPSDVSAADWQFLVDLVSKLEAANPRNPDAIAAARSLAQASEFNTGAPDARSRDRLMAENLMAALGDRRGLYWGHNAHVSHPPDKRGARMTAGSRLGELTEYAALALSFREGGFLAQLPNDLQDRLQTFEVPRADDDSIDGVLAPLGNAVVTWLGDTSTAPAWLTVPRPMHWIGALFSNQFVSNQWSRDSQLLRDYDGVVVFQHVDAEPSTEIGINRAP